jgi:hypothetical protein
MSALRLSLSILQYLAPGAGVRVVYLLISLDSSLIPGTIDLGLDLGLVDYINFACLLLKFAEMPTSKRSL